MVLILLLSKSVRNFNLALFNICFFFSFHFVCLFVYYFFLYPLHCAGTIYTACWSSNKVNARFCWLSSGWRDRAGTCLSSTKLQDKLMLILSLLSPFVITGKAESCRSRKPASAPARNFKMNLYMQPLSLLLPNTKVLFSEAVSTRKACASFHARFLFFFFLFLHTLSVSFTKKIAFLEKLTRVLERNT